MQKTFIGVYQGCKLYVEGSKKQAHKIGARIDSLERTIKIYEEIAAIREENEKQIKSMSKIERIFYYLFN